MPQSGKSSQNLRAEIAQLAARMIAVDGISDYRAAKRKAALQLGVKPDRFMPTNHEIEQAVSDYQRLFQGNRQPEELNELRLQAVEAMKFLDPFRPRLVGPVLAGTATRFSEIVLHVHCNTPEEIATFLEDRNISPAHASRTVKIRANETEELPAFRFIAGDRPVVLVVFDERHRTVHPLSPVDGKPMHRARIDEVEALLGPDAS
jgi:hypothetical protein